MKNEETYMTEETRKSQVTYLLELIGDCETVDELEDEIEAPIREAYKRNLISKDHFRLLNTEMGYKFKDLNTNYKTSRKGRI